MLRISYRVYESNEKLLRAIETKRLQMYSFRKRQLKNLRYIMTFRDFNTYIIYWRQHKYREIVSNLYYELVKMYVTTGTGCKIILLEAISDSQSLSAMFTNTLKWTRRIKGEKCSIQFCKKFLDRLWKGKIFWLHKYKK